MTSLRDAVTDYLSLRRSMGYKVEGLSKLLLSFVAFCEHRGVEQVQHEVALEWATTEIRVAVTDSLFARRMDAVRLFAKHQRTLDPATQVPDDTIGTRRYQVQQPNVLNDEQVQALLAATRTLSPRFHEVMWKTLLGLLITTGIRSGEVCRLSLDDVDLTSHSLKILDSKFGKSRLVFLHPTTATVLAEYLQAREQWAGNTVASSPMVFLNARAGAMTTGVMSRVFKQIVAAAEIQPPHGHRPYRLHDLRHTYTVQTLLAWYRQGHDVQAKLPLLSTWLGHVDPTSTYWYLHAVPELLGHAANRLETHLGNNDTRSSS